MPFHPCGASTPTPVRQPTSLHFFSERWHTALIAAARRLPLAALIATALGFGLAHANDGDKGPDKTNAAPSGDAALLLKLEQMERRIRTLEGQLKQKGAPAIDGAHAQAPDSAARPGVAKPAKDQHDVTEPKSAKDEKKPGDRKAAASAARPCLLYTSPSPRDRTRSRMPSSA